MLNKTVDLSADNLNVDELSSTVNILIGASNVSIENKTVLNKVNHQRMSALA